MNTFFDLREFLIAFLKKAKICLLLVVIFTVGGILFRFIPLAKEYVSYDADIMGTAANSNADYPYLYEARRTLYIPPIYEEKGNTIIDHSQNIIAAYLACYQNEEVLQPLIDKYFDEAAILNKVNQDAQVKYQFIDSAMRTDFKLSNFYSMFRITNTGNRLISLYVKSSDPDFSQDIVADFEELLSKQVHELVGSYSYSITEGQIGVSLPDGRTGVVLSDYSPKTVRTQPSISYIVKRSIKGGIWGFAAGLALGLLWSFFFYSISQTVYEENDLSEFNIPILASITEKKGKKKAHINDRIISFLRGNKTQFSDYIECGNVIRELIKQKYGLEQTTVALTGSCDYELIEKIANYFNTSHAALSFVPVTNIVYSSEALKQLASSQSVIIVEKLNDSSKVEILRELERARYLNKQILGFVLIS